MFYDNLKQVCDRKGLKITPVVAECGGAKGSITNWKNGAIPNSEIVIRLAERLNVSTDILLLGSEKCTVKSNEENELLELFNNLSSIDKGKIIERAEVLAERAAERATQESKTAAKEDKNAVESVKLAGDPHDQEKYSIMYFDHPASAGTGLFLDETIAEEISVRATPQSYNADFAIPISGDSMEPEFSSGDIVLVESCPNVAQGKVGIFVLDGDVYIKEYGGDRLISYNEAYSPILLKEFETAVCLGRVLGKAEIIK